MFDLIKFSLPILFNSIFWNKTCCWLQSPSIKVSFLISHSCCWRHTESKHFPWVEQTSEHALRHQIIISRQTIDLKVEEKHCMILYGAENLRVILERGAHLISVLDASNFGCNITVPAPTVGCKTSQAVSSKSVRPQITTQMWFLLLYYLKCILFLKC